MGRRRSPSDSGSLSGDWEPSPSKPKFSLTLLSSEDWSKNARLLTAARKASASIRKRGSVMACCESYGGNTLNLTYPYLHISREIVPLRERLQDAIEFNATAPKTTDGRMEHADYCEVDTHMEEGDEREFRLESARHLIFIGLRVRDQHETKANMESTWRKWSKADMLLQTLRRNAVRVAAVTMLRQVPFNRSSANINLFTYCFLVAVKVDSQNDRISCLNVLQKLRGSLIPGYVSLFERSRGGRQNKDGRSRSTDSLDQLIEGMEALAQRSNDVEGRVRSRRPPSEPVVERRRTEIRRGEAGGGGGESGGGDSGRDSPVRQHQHHARHFSDAASRNIGGGRRRHGSNMTSNSI